MLDDALSEQQRIKAMPRVAAVAAMGLIMILAAALRLCELNVSLWLDEVLTHHGASGSFLDSLAHWTYPFCYALAYLSVRFSDSEIALGRRSVTRTCERELFGGCQARVAFS